MSKYSDMAEAEAARAEADPEGDKPDEPDKPADPDEPDKPADPDEPAEPEARAPTKRQLAAFERAVTEHATQLGRIVGPDFDLWTVCPHCSGVGHSPLPIPPPRELRADPASQRCAHCGGWGYFETESLVETERERRCLTCGGTGLVAKLETPPPQPVAVPQVAMPPPPQWDPVTGQWTTQPAYPGANGEPAASYPAPVPSPGQS